VAVVGRAFDHAVRSDARLEEMGVDPSDTPRVQRVCEIMVEDIVVKKPMPSTACRPWTPSSVGRGHRTRTSYALARHHHAQDAHGHDVASRVVVTPQLVK
jgi:hypothetical protein